MASGVKRTYIAPTHASLGNAMNHRVSSVLRVVVALALIPHVLVACGDDIDDGSSPGSDSGVDAADAGGFTDVEDTSGGPDTDAQSDGDSDTTSPDSGDDAEDTDGSGTDDVGPDVPEVPDLEWCESEVGHLWDPLSAEELQFFPDGLLVRQDEESPTGWRLDVTDESAPWIAATPDILADSFGTANDLSGFGTQGGILLRFSGTVNDVPLDAQQSVENSGWQWWDLGAEPPERVPFEARVLEEGRTVILWPLRTLRLATEHAFVMTRDAVADDGECISPSTATRQMLHGEPENERMARFAPSYRAALERIGVLPEDVSAITVYPTHNDLVPVRDVAELVVEEDVEWLQAGDCIQRDVAWQCEARTSVLDYRDERGLVNPDTEPLEQEIPLTYWLPLEGEGPFPVIVYGHGLNSERSEGYEIARRMAGDGFAVVAMEAVQHGEHPSVDPSTSVGGDADQPALRFLGIDLANFKIDVRAIRGNFNQTNIDRLRLIELIRQDGDIDGDGEVELDGTRIGYIGASLGAIGGSGLLALSRDLEAAALIIGGGRLLAIVTETESLDDYRPIIDAVIGSPVLFDRLMPVAQHLVDPADSATWAPHVIDDRFDGRTAPSVLATFAMGDDVVPPASGRALARAMNLPHFGEVFETVELVELIPEGPLSGNINEGSGTAGFFQLDRITRNGNVRVASHTDTAKSDEVSLMIRTFFIPWAEGEVPVIVDPYVELETPPLDGE